MTNEKNSYLFELDGAWMSSSSSFSSAGSNNTDNLNRLVELTHKRLIWTYHVNNTNDVFLLVGSMRYVSGLMRSIVTPRSGSVRRSCLCCFSKEVALYWTNLHQKKQQQKKTFGYFSLKHQVVCIMLKLLARFMELEEQLIYVLLPLVSSICCVGLMLASFGIHTYKGSFILNLC